MTKKKIEYSYDDYKYSIIMAAEQLSMNKSIRWTHKTFNNEMNNLLVQDETLTVRNLNDLFLFFTKFSYMNLITKLMEHKNITIEILKNLNKYLNNSMLGKVQYYIALFNLDLWYENKNIDDAFMENNVELDISILLNKRVVEEYPMMIYTILRTATYPENKDKLSMIKEHVVNNEMLLPFVLKLHEADEITDFLPTNITDIFLF